MVELIESKNLKRYINIAHGYFTRLGGVSSNDFSSLNLGFTVNDEVENVVRNHEIIANFLGISIHQFIGTNLIHGNEVVEYSTESNLWRLDKVPNADGVITRERNIAILIRTADCIPVVIYDPKTHWIGACHIGWRGAFAGMAKSMLNSLLSKGVQSEDLIVSFLPSILQESYEVDQVFYDNSCEARPNNRKFFIDGEKKHKYLFDLPGYVYKDFIEQGVKEYNIECSNIDSFTNEDVCFSHRRATKANKKTTGRNLSFIMLK